MRVIELPPERAGELIARFSWKILSPTEVAPLRRALQRQARAASLPAPPAEEQPSG